MSKTILFVYSIIYNNYSSLRLCSDYSSKDYFTSLSVRLTGGY